MYIDVHRVQSVARLRLARRLRFALTHRYRLQILENWRLVAIAVSEPDAEKWQNRARPWVRCFSQRRSDFIATWFPGAAAVPVEE